MTPRSSLRIALAAAIVLIGVLGCERDLDPLQPAPFPSNGEVFLDGVAAGIRYEAYAFSKVDALEFDNEEFYKGTASLRLTVPVASDPSGGFAGGAVISDVPRDLSSFNALTFWAKASTAARFNLAGIGDNNTGESTLTATWAEIPLSTSWTKYVIPIPDPSKLTQEEGLFNFADGSAFPVGYQVWMDEIQFENLNTIASEQPAIDNRTIDVEVGGTATVTGTRVSYDIAGKIQTINAAPAYFSFSSSDPSVATVDQTGLVQVVGEGTAVIRAKLRDLDASGALTINTTNPPDVAPPTPDRPAADVISLFSDAYDDVPVDTWSADFDNADVDDVQIQGDNVKKYSNLGFAGIEFVSHQIDASRMTAIHFDLWTEDTGAFRFKLVDFGPDGAFGGGDDTEHEIILTGAGGSESGASTPPAAAPPIVKGAWNSVDIPLSEFVGLTNRKNLAQIIIAGSSPTVYLDNIYFFTDIPSAPTEPAPTPTFSAANVISMFSNAYDNVPVDTWSTVWDDTTLEDVQIAGNDTKLYTNLVFAGIEATAPTIDASAMERFRIDVWTPGPTTPPSVFKVQLVDFGADGAFGGGDDVLHELTFDANTTPAVIPGTWSTIDVPLSDFTGLTTRSNIAQMILVGTGDLNTLYVDNVLFYRAPPTEPVEPAPTPTQAPENVISMFSNAYTDVLVDRWSTDWDDTTVDDVQVAGDDVKLYTNLVFAGIEATSQPIDASSMERFRIDVWTPDPTTPPSVFKVQLVDFGADGAFGGGDDVLHELTFDANTTPAVTQGTWSTIDVPLSDFTGLTTRSNIAQMILVGTGDLNTVYVDNVFFYK